MQAKPALNNFSAPDPGGGRPVAGSQDTTILALFWKNAESLRFCSPHPFHATFEIGENSPKLGARNDEPQEPLIVRPISSETVQLNAAFGLLVPPTSLYWSCRHDPSISSFRIRGSELASPMIGTFTCVNTAQTERNSGSLRVVVIVLLVLVSVLDVIRKWLLLYMAPTAALTVPPGRSNNGPSALTAFSLIQNASGVSL